MWLAFYENREVAAAMLKQFVIKLASITG